MDLIEAVKRVRDFETGDLTNLIASIEDQVKGTNLKTTRFLCASHNVDSALLDAAFVLKRAAGQINVTIHTVGILVSLPYILRDNETIESLSLGAGNTGRPFDLETSLRVAEFKFIDWKGGSEAIRQNSLFKDYYSLAECRTKKKRYLYVLGLDHPMKFFNGGRAIKSVLSRNNKLWDQFENLYGARFNTVKEYYDYRKGLVEIVDISDIIKFES